mgnify:FL=1
MKKRLIIGIYIFGIITIVNSHYSFAADLNVQESTSLKTLNVTVGNLEPGFSKDITEYNLNISKDINEIAVEAIPENEEAIVNIQGNKNIGQGENKIYIDVITNNGDTKRYTINVNKEKERLRLTRVKYKKYDNITRF